MNRKNILKICATAITVVTSIFFVGVTSLILHEFYHVYGAIDLQEICYIGYNPNYGFIGWTIAAHVFNRNEIISNIIQLVYVIVIICPMIWVILKCLWDK